MALTTKTIVGRWLSPSQPTSGSGTTPARGKIIFTLSNPITDELGNQIVAPMPITANLDFEGRIQVNLYTTDVLGLNQPETFYRVTEEIRGAHRRTYNITVKSTLSNPTDLADIAPFNLSPAVSTAVLVKAFNEHIGNYLNVHGIADTRILETQPGALAKANDARMSAQAYADSLVGVGNQARPGNTFVFTQLSPTTTWTITHNLNSYPSVTVVDSAGSVVEGDPQYLSANALTVTFSSAFSGAAYLN